MVLSAGYGVTDELHQSFVPGRVPSWLDIGYDTLGALFGLVVAELAVLFRGWFTRRAN